jgi:hypothetical protein
MGVSPGAVARRGVFMSKENEPAAEQAHDLERQRERETPAKHRREGESAAEQAIDNAREEDEERGT